MSSLSIEKGMFVHTADGATVGTVAGDYDPDAAAFFVTAMPNVGLPGRDGIRLMDRLIPARAVAKRWAKSWTRHYGRGCVTLRLTAAEVDTLPARKDLAPTPLTIALAYQHAAKELETVAAQQSVAADALAQLERISALTELALTHIDMTTLESLMQEKGA